MYDFDIFLPYVHKDFLNIFYEVRKLAAWL